jgi:hypothetical protein
MGKQQRNNQTRGDNACQDCGAATHKRRRLCAMCDPRSRKRAHADKYATREDTPTT